MGLAASQARLLTITARLADNELRSQTINNAKMRLATQSSQASENYISALNNATMKFSNYDSTGAGISQDLTYNALTAYSSYNTQYGLSNSSGQILVSEEEAALFAQANGDVNAYLKSHGLEYTTTYFDEIGNVENDDYPSPFNNLTTDELQTYYEQYGSYEASLEKQDYEIAYRTYYSANSALLSATSTAFEGFATYSKNSPALTYDSKNDSYSATLSGNTGSAVLSSLKSMFNSYSNTYGINYLLNKGFISQSVANEAQAVLNSYTSSGTGVKYTTDANFTVPTTTEADGSKIYIVDDYLQITVDSNGNVVGQAVPRFADEAGETTTITQGTSGTDLMTFVNSLGYTYTYTNDDGTTTTSTISYALSKDSNNNYSLKASESYTSDEFKNEIAETVLDEVMSILAYGLNQENFANFLLTQSTSTLANYGISLTNTVDDTNKTISEILAEYKEAKNAYLELIFDKNSGSVNTVDNDIKNGYSFVDDNGDTRQVTPKNLSDIDFVLQYIKNRGLTQSDIYNTIIKENIVDNLIEEYGEPKYAWVDENDTSNAGNADAKAQWYTNLFKRMQQGYKALENGLASSKEWIEYALESGIVTLEQVDTTYRWNSLDYKSCTKITEETDDAAVTKAEAEYNRAMNDIEAKDNIYDIELKNIDTEHTSLQTEYDVIKDVMKKNVERTFKFNQSA
jgi:hypothetical protein